MCDVVMCLECGLGVNLDDPCFHEERYGHEPRWNDTTTTTGEKDG